ncbi:unnamed protein product [Penicillium salamii]|uniref:Uncharacterized protein n=1 Tax=Penicillium salamii TaxID=1612424 RepID=A0A9W4K111_9EURO|nr:unnamed protein product [Penicillium salamii]CAG8415227.1 unnamed protein product [Penicillium salamii]CAG8422108.1 unnamed protein product [Penicillium salamii]CAG8422650.1 unnamed protein product [Penicillium salamii]
MTPRCRSIGPIQSKSQNKSDADSDGSAIFTDNGSKKDSDSKSEPDGDDTDNESDSSDESFNDEGQLPPKHYLAEAEGLDVSQFRQKRYSNSTQKKLDQTAVYYKHLNLNLLKHWQRISDSDDTILLFCQLAVITANRPDTLLGLRYWNIVLTLIRDPEGGCPRLFIYLTPEFTKRFLGKKALNEFKIPKIIFDPTLALSLHICLLGILFHIKGFKTRSSTRPILDCPENLYCLRILEGLKQQQLILKGEILNKFVFCQVIRDVTGYRIDLKKQIMSSIVRSRMRRVGEITDIELIKPYNL